ncbi:MAG TPA: FtsX-like permease family protein [Chitinophagaceae bacterium]|nr:FtsX-like permease family protein [Chitinophagaceae bacterium]
MFKNYFKTAFRNFARNKSFSLINVSGLTIGISASLVIYMIVSFEFGFDKFEPGRDRVYRVVTNMMFPGNPFKLSGAPVPLASAVQKDITGIEASANFELYWANVTMPGKTAPVIYKGQDKIIFADDNYFKLFPYKWVSGSAAALQQPFKVVLTESRARQYFGTLDYSKIAGQTITYNDSVKVAVAGIVQDNTETSDLTFKEFISLGTIPASNLKNDFNWSMWGGASSQSQFFIRLSRGANSNIVQKQIQALQDNNSNKGNLQLLHPLQALSAIHFDAEYDNFNERQSQEGVMYGLLAVAAFLLLLGCINFINLTTAQATQRAKEIGIRKTMGGTKKQLVFQFLAETFLLTLAATAISVAVTPLLLKTFASYIPEGVGFNMIMQPHVIVFMVLLVISVSLFSGLYPAFVLSRFNPVEVLKNQVVKAGGANSRRALLRKSLTVAQFVIAQFFIIGTIVVGKQIHYALNADMGYRKDAIINIETPYDAAQSKRPVFLQKVQEIPEIQTAVLSGPAPASFGISASLFHYIDGKKDVQATAESKNGDSAYFALYNMKLLAGRYLRQADTAGALLVNNTFAQQLGFTNPANLVGRFIKRGDKSLPVIGVMADIHTKSLHSAIQPLAYETYPRNYHTVHVLLKPKGDDGEAWKTALNKMEAAWKEVYPDNDFDYAFFDETLAKFYQAEQSTSTLLTWATGLAIFISCLGLLGLAIYTTNQRTKEIGVRKVLGATVQQIVLLLSKDFVALIVVAFVIAVPLAWVATYKWLQTYPYHTALSWWVFGISGVLLLIIALAVLSTRTISTANANPVKSLRSE